MVAHAGEAAWCSVQQCERRIFYYEREELLAIFCRQENAVCTVGGWDNSLLPLVSHPVWPPALTLIAPVCALCVLLGGLPEIKCFGKCAEAAIDATAAVAVLTEKQNCQ